MWWIIWLKWLVNNIETETYLLGHITVYSVECQPTFPRNVISIFTVEQGVKKLAWSKLCYLLHASFSLGPAETETKCSSETLVDFKRTTRRHIPEDRTHNHRCENLKSYNHSLTHSWSWALLEKLPIVQLLKNFPAFYWTRRFITAFTRALPWSLS
jgi:hypothetical protein